LKVDSLGSFPIFSYEDLELGGDHFDSQSVGNPIPARSAAKKIQKQRSPYWTSSFLARIRKMFTGCRESHQVSACLLRSGKERKGNAQPSLRKSVKPERAKPTFKKNKSTVGIARQDKQEGK
jgi:hypothetical protein